MAHAGLRQVADYGFPRAFDALGPALRTFKVVVITDRVDLEKQLVETAALAGDVVRRAKKTATLKTLLAEEAPSLVFAMIQKYRDQEAESEGTEFSMLGDGSTGGSLGMLNDDERIVILVDEAHRSHTLTLHGNLIKALPNAAKIGFTGTPIMRTDKKRTDAIFGPYIDVYTIRESEADGMTVPILYEGRTAKGAVNEASHLDQIFEDLFEEPTPERLAALKQRYATHGAVLEAPLLIQAKARDMLLHYVSTVMPNGFKAQVAAASRRAAVRYRTALLAARDSLAGEIEALPEQLLDDIDLGIVDVGQLAWRQQVLIRARGQLSLLRDLEFVPVISSDPNDDPTWADWANRPSQEAAISRFKQPLGPATEETSPTAFLIVKSMLLTGFDAPFEQVLYLDRPIHDAELLQAIARVNRRAPGKLNGLLVDYCGVGAHLRKALEAYAPEDAESTIGAMHSIVDELPKLEDRHDRVVAVFAQAGIENFDREEDVEACVQVLSDPSLRARFDARLEEFMDTLEIILPRPEALPYARSAKRFGVIQFRARRRYRDSALGDFDPSLYGEKVRCLIDEHIAALDIARKVPPVSVTDPEFLVKVRALSSVRARASEMEHALRFHIGKNFDEDPSRYAKLSERLDAILNDLRGKWDLRAAALAEMVDDVGATDEACDGDLLVARFLGVIEEEAPRDRRDKLGELSVQIVALAARESALVNFWNNAAAQESLRKKLVVILYDEGGFDLDEAPATADRLMELARSNRDLLAGWG